MAVHFATLYYQCRRLAAAIRRNGMYGMWRKITYSLVYTFRYRSRCERVTYTVAQAPDHVSTVRFSIIIPCYRTDPRMLLAAVASVRAQSYPHWELCLGASELDPNLVAEIEALGDERIRIVPIARNRGISANSNAAAAAATGEYLGLMDHDDVLHPDALRTIAEILAAGKYDLVYTDEDKIGISGSFHFQPHIKPDWAPDTMLSHNYICHFTIVRKRVFDAVGGFRSAYDGAQDFDLFLRVSEHTQAIAHVPRVLYSWRVHPASTAGDVALAKPYAVAAGVAAVRDHLQRRHVEARAEEGLIPCTVRVRYPCPHTPEICVVVPILRAHRALADQLRRLTDHASGFRYIVVCPATLHAELAALTADFPTELVSIDNCGGACTTGALLNAGAASARTELLLFQDPRVVMEKGTAWLRALAEHALRPEIGAVGPCLLRSNGRVFHSGISLWAGLRHRSPAALYALNHCDYGARLKFIQNVTAVSHLCMMTKQSTFQALGGFDSVLAGLYGIDFGLKARAHGLRTLFTPYARGLYTNDRTIERIEKAGMHCDAMLLETHWGEQCHTDHYFCPAFLSH